MGASTDSGVTVAAGTSGHPLVRGVGMCLEESGWDRSFYVPLHTGSGSSRSCLCAPNRLRTGMRSETEQVGKPGLKDLQGGVCSPPFLMSGSTDGGRVCNGANIKEHHP